MRNNLRVITDAFKDNVQNKIPTTLVFDGERLHLMCGTYDPKVIDAMGKVGLTSDLSDDTVYRLIGDDIDQVAEELEETLQGAEFIHVKQKVEQSMGSSWRDIVALAIEVTVNARREI